MNVLNCRISRAFERNLLAWRLCHAGAQAVDVPIGRRKVSQFQALSDSGSPGSSSPGPVRRPPDPGPPRAAGQYGRPGRGGNRRDGGRDRTAGSCCHSRPPVPQCFPRRPPQGPGSRRRTGPRPGSARRGMPGQARPFTLMHPGSHAPRVRLPAWPGFLIYRCGHNRIPERCRAVPAYW